MPGQAAHTSRSPYGLTPSGQVTTAQFEALRRLVLQLERQQNETSRQQQSTSTTAAATSSHHVTTNVVADPYAGPAAPPEPSSHSYSRLRAEFRALLEFFMDCIEVGLRPWQIKRPTSQRGWPMRTVHGENGEAPSLVRCTRPAWDEGWMSRTNQAECRPLIDMMLAQRGAHGVPAEMTREQLVRVLASTFNHYRREFRDAASEAGRLKKQRIKKRSVVSSRLKGKHKKRLVSLGLNRVVRFADGTQVVRTRATAATLRARKDKRRADLEFAAQVRAQSPFVDGHGVLPNGERCDIWVPMHVPWRSRDLIEVLHNADANSARRPAIHVGECQVTVALPEGFRLPSSIRRWMVASDWAEDHPEACADVSDNAGPFEGEFKVAAGPEEWGQPVPEHLQPTTQQEQGDYFGQAEVGAEASSSSRTQHGGSHGDDEIEDDDDNGRYLQEGEEEESFQHEDDQYGNGEDEGFDDDQEHF
ncbi:hypothetical protein V8E36_006570 [Tilletia maclaganii]